MSDEPVMLELFGDADDAMCIDGVCAVPGSTDGQLPDAGVAAGVETGASEAAG